MKRIQITHQVLREILRYDPDTGFFYWATPRPKIRVGGIAGTFKHHKGYVIIELSGIAYAAHRLAWFYMTGFWPKDLIDHKNGDKADNRFDNLREATNVQNQANSENRNKTGFKGVRYHPWLSTKPYEAQIRHNKKILYLGCFATAEEAHEAYKQMALNLHGDFARF